ncbi:helix-turn-helix domain-containing protein [Tabrizicola sp.]|uniref:helix-turn-helix domain-containing protein n=1 Tax=Tabrizicola sp. TaxID=2005166 RepID=UPI00286C3540|nr:helix-turn-helix domain-containing protein [Tabrizicola sp.]
MPLSALTGTRLRERRLAAGLRQSDVAALAGISASYLNLIEHNRRRVTDEVLVRLATALDLDVQVLSTGNEVALIEDLRVAAAASGEAGPEIDRLEDFVGRFPGWSRLVSQLQGRVVGLERALQSLNDRMTHDPHLSQAVHEVVQALSSVRSTAAILAETEDLDPVWRVRFHRNLHQDSERMAVGAEALVAYLDAGSGAEEQGIAAPLEELEAWLKTRDWRFSDAELSGGLESEVAGLASVAARSLARGYLAQAASDALAMPEAAFRAALQLSGPDPLTLAAQFGTDVLAAMRRVITASDMSAGLVVCDASGTLLLRKPVTGFPLPRFGSACPLWPLYAALGRPMVPVEAVVETVGPAAMQHRVIAFCQTRYPAGLRGPELREAAMLILPQPERSSDVSRVGSTCRICPRNDCPARREPSILSEGR